MPERLQKCTAFNVDLHGLPVPGIVLRIASMAAEKRFFGTLAEARFPMRQNSQNPANKRLEGIQY
jgi:hypothetical protein